MTDITSEVHSMKYSKGDTFTVSRGKLSGQEATVLGVDEGNRSYAVQLKDGSFAVVNEASAKDAGDTSITVGKLASLARKIYDDEDISNEDSFGVLLDDLRNEVPGFSRAFDA